MVYLIAFIAAIIAAFLNKRMTPNLRKSILIILCIYIILIIGFRYKIGIDTIGYMRTYKQIPTILHFFSEKTFSISRWEPGMLFISSVCKTFSNDFWPVQIIMATITNGCIFIFLHRYCKNVFIGVVFYFILRWLYFSTEIMRESAAVAIFLLNYKNLHDKKWVKFYLWSILSILFHYSAIIIWFFPLIKLLKSKILFYTLCIGFILITPLVERLNDMLQIAAISGRIDFYVTGADDLNLNWRLGELLRSAFPAIATILGYRMIKKKYEYHEIILLQILFCLGAFAIPLIFSRFTNYTVMFVVISAANLMTCREIQRWIRSLFFALIFFSQVPYYHQNYILLMPYVSIFHPEEIVERNQAYRHAFMPWLKYYYRK